MNADIFKNGRNYLSFKNYLSSCLQWMVLFVMASFMTIGTEALSSETQEDDAACPFPLHLKTSAVHVYRYLEIPIPVKSVNRIVFEVKSSKDVHIALSPSKNNTDLYEIVIGAGSNTFSTIRRCGSCADLTYRGTAFYLSPDEFRRFWITFGNSGSIRVGKDEELLPFMEWTDPNPLEISYVGYSTGWESTGEFRFCNFGVNLTSTLPSATSAEPWSHAISRVTSIVSLSNETATTYWQPEQPSIYPETTKHSGTLTLWLLAAILVLLFILSAAIYLVIKRTKVHRGTRKTKDATNQLQGEQLSSSNKEESCEHLESNETLNISTNSELVDNKEDFKTPSYVSYAKVSKHPKYGDNPANESTIYDGAYESYDIKG